MSDPNKPAPITHCTESNACPFGEVFYDDQCQLAMDVTWDRLMNPRYIQSAQHIIEAAQQYRCRSELQKVIEETLEVEKARLAMLGSIIVDEIEKIANGEDGPTF